MPSSRHRESLPVDAYLDEVRAHLDRHRAVVVSAAPGAGKTTRIPPALVDRGPVILLQPRRVAARAVTRRIAEEHGWTVGREVGWQIRFERRSSSDTRLLVVTEGILTARLQHDPLLSDFTTVVFDEFHERSIHSDLGLALARHAWIARDDLHIVVMSATLAPAPLTRFLGGCPVVEVPGRLHPVTIEYRPDESVAYAVQHALPRTVGQMLCFLPGVPEIERTARELAGSPVAREAEIVPLHGSIDGDTQDRALRRVEHRRVILATNIAETSLTVPGVTTVIDSGYHKVARYDAVRAIDSLTLERISEDAADQRAGRAGRVHPGLVWRLWDARQRLQPHREADIARLDLAGPVLYLLAWGEHPDRFEWFEPPPAERVAGALRLLERLGAIDARHRVTELGRRMLRIPMHPRLARILLAAHGAPNAVTLCARIGGDAAVAPHLQRVVAQLVPEPAREPIDDDGLRRALFSGYADRLGQRRADAPDRVLLASGHGAVLSPDVPPIGGRYLVALEVVAARRGGVAEAVIRAASEVDEDWIEPTSIDTEHQLDTATGRVRAARVVRSDAIVLESQPVAPDPEIKTRLLAEAFMASPGEDAIALQRRARFAGVTLDLASLAEQAARSADRAADIDVREQLSHAQRQALERGAPERLQLPSGRSVRLTYGDDGSVAASVKLQELFGMAESPRLGPRRIALTFHLLAPNGRPVQTTQDLRSFWTTTYREVRKELRGRYPKHRWPENPWAET